MTRALAAAVVALIACNGSSERTTTPDMPPAPVAKPVPVPERDCAILKPAVERITAAEVAEIHRTRPANVASIAARELERIAPILAEVMPRLCEAEAWSGAYTACMTTARLRDDARACQGHLTQAQVDRLAADVAAGVQAASPYGAFPTECQDYIAALEKFAACDKMPATSRDSLNRSVKQLVDGWSTMLNSASARTAVARSCKSGLDAIRQGIASMGCPP